MSRYAILRRDFRGCGELVYNRPYEIIDEMHNGIADRQDLYLIVSGIEDWYPKSWFKIVDTEKDRILEPEPKPQILAGKRETVNEVMERLAKHPNALEVAAEEIVRANENYHMLVGESAQISFNFKELCRIIKNANKYTI